MFRLLFICLLLGGWLGSPALAQPYYFPPVSGAGWDTTEPAELGWCTDSLPGLYAWLDSTNTRGFLVLKDGRIVLERYFGTFTQDSLWYWASAGKGLTAFLVGIAQEEGALAIHDPTAQYLGDGWTSCTDAREDSITIWHQLTMTTGTNELFFNCTVPACLFCPAAAGTRWAYHNGPYRLLRNVMEAATGQSFNAFTAQRVLEPTGMQGFWLITAQQQLFFSRARDMARFGILIAQQGRWEDTPLLQDTAYWRAMLTPSQELNESYGYLWWLNGQASHRQPASLQLFPGPIAPAAPADLVAALGANGQILDLVPSRGLIVVRMGEEAREDAVPSAYHNELWVELNNVLCPATTPVTEPFPLPDLRLAPNPVSGDRLQLLGADRGQVQELTLFGPAGSVLRTSAEQPELDVARLPAGVYFVRARLANGATWRSKVVLLR
jgi:CubicO group peptidase (beta-lactamase class C family)